MKVTVRVRPGLRITTYEQEEFDTPEYKEKERQEKERWFKMVKAFNTPEWRDAAKRLKEAQDRMTPEELEEHARICEGYDE